MKKEIDVVKMLFKLYKIIAILVLSIVLLFLALVMPTWPTKAKLCQDVEQYLPKAECMQLENHVEIVKRAFPEGDVSSSDVKSALGEYLHDEYLTTFGHREVYYLSARPINHLFNYFDSYDFRYDNNGVLTSIRYDDF